MGKAKAGKYNSTMRIMTLLKKEYMYIFVYFIQALGTAKHDHLFHQHSPSPTTESWHLAPAAWANPVDPGLLPVCLLELPCTTHLLLSGKLVKRIIKTSVTSKLSACYMQR